MKISVHEPETPIRQFVNFCIDWILHIDPLYTDEALVDRSISIKESPSDYVVLFINRIVNNPADMVSPSTNPNQTPTGPKLK